MRMRNAAKTTAGVFLAGLSVIGLSCVAEPPDDGKIHLQYWEKWVRFEGQAMQRVVDAFNASQDRIVVHMEAFGPVDRKTLLATAGGNPPDVVGMWAPQVASHADHNALTPLDGFMAADGLPREHWLPVYIDLCTVRGRVYAVPTTPTTLALYWNKALFRAAKLDPERPPRTLAELDEFARKLTRLNAEGDIVQMGFLPWEPDWYLWGLGPWFGGELFDGENITANHPRNVEAFEWLQSYSREYGVDRIKRFMSGFGSFASPQNAFFAGKVAMGFHGVWLHNYITQYAPGMEYGAAPWPKTPHGPDGFSIADMDVLVMPAGVPPERQQAAWEFIRFVSSQKAMEMLNLGQRKNSPLARISETFVAEHPHPYIRLFVEMSRSPNVIHLPQMGIWVRYEAELRTAAERLRLLEISPHTGQPYTAREVLDEVQQRIALAWRRHQESLRKTRKVEKSKSQNSSALGTKRTPESRKIEESKGQNETGTPERQELRASKSRNEQTNVPLSPTPYRTSIAISILNQNAILTFRLFDFLAFPARLFDFSPRRRA